MSPQHFLRIVGAELRKTFTRGAGLFSLGLAVVLPLGTFGVIHWLTGASGASMNGQPVSNMITVSATAVVLWSLTVRNFFFQPLALMFAATASVAGEYGDRTIREVLVRPVPRWGVLLPRLVAIAILSAVGLVLTYTASLAIGLPFFGLPSPPAVPEDYPNLLDLVGGYAVAWLADVCLITLTMMISVIIRSVGGAVVVFALWQLLDFGFYWGMKGLAMLNVQQALTMQQFTLHAGLSAWQGCEGGYEVMAFVTLGVYMLVGVTVLLTRFSRLDAP